MLVLFLAIILLNRVKGTLREAQNCYFCPSSATPAKSTQLDIVACSTKIIYARKNWYKNGKGNKNSSFSRFCGSVFRRGAGRISLLTEQKRVIVINQDIVINRSRFPRENLTSGCVNNSNLN